MRLVSVGPSGAEEPAVLRTDGIVPVRALDPSAPRSLRALLAADVLGALGALAERAATWRGALIDPATVRLGPPIPDAQKIICIGLNYKGHATEQGKPWPEQPLLFAKTANTLCGPGDDIRYPSADAALGNNDVALGNDVALDYEVELAVVIGRRARAVPVGSAMAHVAGYFVANDVSARRWQRGDGQWYRGKSCDTFFPCGPALVTADEVPDIGALRLTTRVNDELLQDATAADLIHDVPTLIAYISRDITLEPGDIISTGTPAGVGCFRQPPRALQPGDIVECAISGLGALRNRVVR